MELVPHITLNPSFNIDMLEYIEPGDESSSGATTTGGGVGETIRGDFRGIPEDDHSDEGDEVNLVNSPVRSSYHHGGSGNNSVAGGVGIAPGPPPMQLLNSNSVRPNG